jgi:hypothetical protein
MKHYWDKENNKKDNINKIAKENERLKLQNNELNKNLNN